MRVMVTGGAGYIGSHAVKCLRERRFDVLVVDDLRTGHREAVEGVALEVADVRDEDAMLQAMRLHGTQAVMHFAASCQVAESVARPLDYWSNNVGGTLALARAALAAGVEVFVLSSTAATYGEPARVPIEEDDERRPINPYGRTKVAAEDLLTEAAAASSLTPVFLRYFNAAGADPGGELGEDHDPETHLIPNAVRAALGLGPRLRIFGDDYPTPDGTCVRDYVHVSDLAEAHVLALEWAASERSPRAFNLGNGAGFSVREVVEAVGRVTGRAVPHEVAARRPGDPPVLVASSERARSELGWRPRFADLDTIAGTAARWIENHPRGYGG